MSYEWIKVVHLLSIISWMAGLFYLPRLFVYHSDQPVGSAPDLIFKIMERRLLKAIMRPAAAVSVLSGLALVFSGGYGFGEHWLSAKLLGVLGLLAFHGVLESHVVKFAAGQRGKTGRYYRVINEVPTALLIWIVVWVVVKPFQ
jgi:protoporphyrinogen IX oxidase